MPSVLLVYYEPTPAGQTTHVVSLGRELRQRGHEVSVLLPIQLRGPAEALDRAGIQAYRLPMGKLVWPVGTLIALARLIRQQRFDIIHVHSQEAGLVARLAARLAGAPNIVYTPQVINIRRNKLFRLYVFIERCLAQVTDVIVSVSLADRERMLGWGIPPAKIVPIPNGIDPGAIELGPTRQLTRQSLGFAAGQPLVMQVGRLSAQKDPLSFVKGAARVLVDRPDCQFAMLGTGPLRAAVEAHLNELGVHHRVRLLGWRPDAPRLMIGADVVTLTSRWEGVPFVLLEAMRAARPVVATEVNGCPEVVVDGVTGFLVPPGDAELWADRVLHLLKDPARAAVMGQAGRSRLEAQFSLQVMVDRVEDLYTRLCSAGR